MIPEGGKLLVLDPELLAERRRLFDENGLSTAHADYAVQSGPNWWVCACGQLNVRRAACWLCRAKREFLEKTEDAKFLQQSAEKRAAADREAEQEAQRAEEAKRERRAKTKKGFKIAIPIVSAIAIVAIAVAILVTVILPRNAFNDAKAEFDAGNYEAAYDKFIALGDFGEAQEWADSSARKAGGEALAAGDRRKAIEWIELIKDEDSANRAKSEYIESHMDASDPTTVSYLKELLEAGYEGSEELYFKLANIRVDVKVVGVDEEVTAANVGSLPDLGRSFDWSNRRFQAITFAYRFETDFPDFDPDAFSIKITRHNGRVEGNRVVRVDALGESFPSEVAEPTGEGWYLGYANINDGSLGDSYLTYRVDFMVTNSDQSQIFAKATVDISHPEFAGLEISE